MVMQTLLAILDYGAADYPRRPVNLFGGDETLLTIMDDDFHYLVVPFDGDVTLLDTKNTNMV